MSAGSAQTRSEVRLTRSDTSSATAGFPRGKRTPAAIAKRPSRRTEERRARNSRAKAGCFSFSCSIGFILAFSRTTTGHGVIRTRLQIDIDVVNIAHDIGIIAERGHYRSTAAPSIHHNVHEIVVIHMFEGVGQRRSEGAAHAIGR